jgi:hypothetical protein
MRKTITLIGIVTALAVAGTASAGGSGAEVVNDAGCYSTWFAKVCTTIKTVTKETTTPSGNVAYMTNGTVENTMTFISGSTFTRSSRLQSRYLAKQGEITTATDHYDEVWESVSGTYHLVCTYSYDIQVAGGEGRVLRYELECTVL